MKDQTSADLTALEKKGLDQKTNHQGFTKAKTEEIFVSIKANEEKETVALKLWQSAKEATTLERQVQQRQRVWCGLHPRTWSTRLQAKKG